MSETPERIVARIVAAIEAGTLSSDELTTRGLGAYLGRTTGQIYHHFGSLDGLLFAVMQAGFQLLSQRLAGCSKAGGGAAAVAAEFVDFGLSRPVLYRLMFERHYDWATLRGRGLLGPSQPDIAMYNALIAELSAAGASEPTEDARLFLAGLHGLVSLALSGRANVGTLARSDRQAAIGSARRLARLLFGRADDAANRASERPRHSSRERRKPSRIATGKRRKGS
jgi:AcrR family transcriptional regulator